MGTTRIPLCAAVASLVTVAVWSPGADIRSAGADEAPFADPTEGTFANPWVEVFFPGQFTPQPSRMYLVESGASGDARTRFRVRIAPGSRTPTGGSIAGRVVGRLVPDRTYDIEVRAARGDSLFARFPSAFTARAPRFAKLLGSSAAPGESVGAVVDFAPAKLRFQVNGISARVTADLGDGSFAFIVPPGSSPGRATVTASARGVSLDAPEPLTVLSNRRELAATVDGIARRCSTMEYDQSPGSASGGVPELVIQGSRAVHGDGRGAAFGFVLRLPADVATLEFPATFSEADGARVEWFNSSDGGRGPWFAGPRWSYSSTTCSVTLTSLVGARLSGTFDARMRDVLTLGHDPVGLEFDLAEGRFDVLPAASPQTAR